MMYSQTWDIEKFFKNGSDSVEFSDYLKLLEESINEMGELTKVLTEEETIVTTNFKRIIELLELNGKRLYQSSSFVGCLQAQNMKDLKADLLYGKVTDLSAKFQNTMNEFDIKLSSFDDPTWLSFLRSENYEELDFVLNERRRNASELLPFNVENAITELSIDGYHSWEQLYDKVVSKFNIEHDGKNLSAGQAHNLFSINDRNTRKIAFQKWEEEWETHSDYLASIINHLSGFRLKVYKLRGWDDVLSEPLKYNRMSKATLNAMWEAVTKNKNHLIKYLNRKAEILGVNKLSWYDLYAPLGSKTSKITYQESAEFIIQKFGEFGTNLKNFTVNAFENKWIEAEDRAGKRPGGFCTGFPEQNESRIFMTFSGTPTNVSTLAHELGHAFHSYAMKDLHFLNTDYAMNVAETASTFAETIVLDAAINNVTNTEEKIALLDEKLQNAVAFMMNIHARFIYETNFYSERKSGVISKNRINELMLSAQKEAYCDSLDQYHPLFWCSKMHFYFTGVPFYNFPYTFGYLFSLGIYARSFEDNENFEQKYIELLRDTGRMTVEELAIKHLGVDLTQIDFWDSAVKLALKDVDTFLELTDK